MASTEPLVWIDCEMTGLDPEVDTILEIACFVTDHDLNLLEKNGFGVVVHHSQHRLDQMDEWCKSHHGASGLTRKAVESVYSHEAAAEELLKYVKQYARVPRTALLAGNSVHADKSFLSKPPYNRILDHLHYRILDVSSLKEAARRWAPDEILKQMPLKKNLHEARADILESIEEAKWYKKTFFQNKK